MKVHRFRKKALSLFLMLALILSMLPGMAAVAAPKYKDGTYEGTGQGFKSEITLSITIEGGSISAIDVVSQNDTANYWNKAVALLETIKATNSADVDAITGATYSSNGIKEAASEALSKAVSSEDEVVGPFASGEGTEKNPYKIATAEQLAAFATSVDEGESYEGQYIVLANDIDVSSVDNWNPIGVENSAMTGGVFNGNFDGQNFVISGMNITGDYSQEVNMGLFSTLGTKSVVKNVVIKNGNIALTGSDTMRAGLIAGDTVGGKSGEAAAVINHCVVDGSVDVNTSGAKLAFGGGVLGRAMAATVVINCYSDVDTHVVSSGGNNSGYAGGIFGTSGNYVVVVNCAAEGDVYASSPRSTNFGGMAGGISGMMGGFQYNVYATGDVTIGNQKQKNHSWVGALNGELTTGGGSMVKQGNTYDYDAEKGPSRAFGYYANDITLKTEHYSGLTLEDTITNDLVAMGSSTTLTTFDSKYQTDAMAPADMTKQAFADTLNGNIPTIQGYLAAYGFSYDALVLNEWIVSDGKVLPGNDKWEAADPDAGIFASGSGTEKDPYMIKTADQMRSFANSLSNKIDYSDQFVALANDIDISGSDWTPVGGSDYAFNGTFDGRGHTISGMTIGSQATPQELDEDHVYIGLFGVLDKNAVVKDLTLDQVAVYTHYSKSAYVGGVAAVMDGDSKSSLYNGAIIDSVNVKGTLSHVGDNGNQFVGGLVGMQYKGAIINSSADVQASCVTKSSAIAEAGALVALNNRGLVANSYATGTVTGSGSRTNGDEGMASIAMLIGVDAGVLTNCYVMPSSKIETAEYSTYAGLVTGWITGIGKAYNNYYSNDSTVIVNGQTITPPEAIGTKVSSGVNDEGDAYIGGLADAIESYPAMNDALASKLNDAFAKFPADVTNYGLKNNALKNWTVSDGIVTFGDNNPTVTYVQPEVEKVVKPEAAVQDGTFYGRSDDKSTVVKITVKDGEITETDVLSGEKDTDAYQASLERATDKSVYGDTTHYEAADPAKFAGGSGTKEDPYQIANEEQLRYLATSVNEDVDWDNTWFVQTADIKLSNKDWQPIGFAINAEVNNQKKQVAAYIFRGNFDGAGHTIDNLTIGSADAPADVCTPALFGLTGGDFTGNEEPTAALEAGSVHLSNIHLTNVSINVDTRYETYAAGLVGSGQNGIYIDNCSVTGAINVNTRESFARAGGLAANALRGAITDSWTDVDINAVTDTSNVYAGGMFALTNRVTVINCYALGNVTGNSSNTNKVHIGGLTGQAGGVQINCYALGDVISLKPTSDVGGLNGRSGGIAIDYNSYFSTDAVQRNGSTTNDTNVGIGVAVNGTPEEIAGKSAAELASADFATLLNDNRAGAISALKGEIAEKLAAKVADGFVHQIYYTGDGSDLNEWYVTNKVVGFEKSATPDEDGVTLIYTAEDLANVANNLSGNYKLMADIDLSDYSNWTPLGAFVPKGEGEEAELANPEMAFSGVFDGNGHTISNLKVDSTYAAGLFGCVAQREGVEDSGIVKNLTIENANVSATAMGAAAVGYASVGAEIDNVQVKHAKVRGVNSDELGAASMIGGVVGAGMDALVSNCVAEDVSIEAEGVKDAEGIGSNVTNMGILGGGLEDCTIEDCVAKDSTLTIKGNSDDAYGFGGLVGCAMSAPSVTNCEVDNVTITAGKNVQLIGGLAGYTGQMDGQEPTEVKNCAVTNTTIKVGKDASRIGGMIGGGFYFDEYAEYYPEDTVANIDGDSKVENTTITAGSGSTEVDKVMGRQAKSTIDPDVSVDGTRVTIQSNSSGGGGGAIVNPGQKDDPQEPGNNDNPPVDADNPFVDVAANDYYRDAVVWAVKEGITSGTDATHFSPDGSCTRAQAVTFLWRANGSPIVDGENIFTDVEEDAYYADAVRWAVAEGITVGTSATTFSPDATCTRAQIVTMLHRAAGTPEAEGTLFADVAADAYYADAVQWAVAEDITSGTSATTFSPEQSCTRAQIVTFIYRQMK